MSYPEIRVLCVVGTRPEAIKMAPVIQALQAAPWADVRVLATAQHRQMLDQVLDLYGIRPDIDLDIMQEGQALASLTARLIEQVDAVLEREAPSVVVAQGDTTTVLAVALACFYRNIPFAHVEAGLRTHDKRSPFPEEMNRFVAGYLASLHFAPTARARENLLVEGVPDDSIAVTGNTVIDALLQQAARGEPPPPAAQRKRQILVTTHRRENFGAPMVGICDAILELVAKHEDVNILFPVHPNPLVRQVVYGKFDKQPRVVLCEPLGYADFVAALNRSWLVLTDSGGIQEEAPALGKPVLVLRDMTERPEAIDAGVAQLIGVEPSAIVTAVERLLSNPEEYQRMSRSMSPYGDGKAAARIAQVLKKYMEKSSSRNRIRPKVTPELGAG